ncbi:hypothetical protein BCR34DRAFT_640042 [Clohesyomyces aquaticus]|uniref:Glucose-methanol-choline oxidoreductase N-terminal domain-containing protein n=1 Tax=Clohesyomyces aquaticus TaxID=1231657 RepID=A0A1Y1YMT7_9PLEO|nr:hypothetical protein BCR34DRAFT_640042 [Clohesyomyces aquaticus]
MPCPLSGLLFAFLVRIAASGPVSQHAAFACVNEQTYDYIIVGGGTSGLVVANRLSEDSTKSVLVIEKGYIDDSPSTSIPYQIATTLNTLDMHPNLISAPEPYLRNQSFPVWVANVVGGGSISALGSEGWSYKDLEPYFKKASHFTPPSESTREAFNITYDVNAYGNGPIQVSIPSFQFPDYKTIFAAWKAENVSMPKEGFNSPVGAFWAGNTIENNTATRSHARKSYYEPIKGRPNLKLLTGTHVDEILFEGSEKLVASGAKITSRADGSTGTVCAAKEVILAAGAIFTPHLLLVSGLGPKDVLDRANVTVKKNIPGVGSNLQDHVPVAMVFNLSNQTFPNPSTIFSNTSFNASAISQYETSRSGPYSSAPGNALAFLTLQQISSKAKYQSLVSSLSTQNPLSFLPKSYSTSPTLLAGFLKQREILIAQFLSANATVGEYMIQPWGQSTTALQKPLSRGTITLNTTHPHAYPIIQYNALQNPIDRAVICELVRFNRQHWARAELSRYSPIEHVPGAQYQSDEEILEGLLKVESALTPSFAHQSGGCAMMSEKLGGCVSDKLMVHGVRGLSVVDASLMPMIPATHLQATVYAVAEKAADVIKRRD